MRKQTQTRHSSYISPKCRTIRLDAGYCSVTSPGDGNWNQGGAGNSGSIFEEEI